MKIIKAHTKPVYSLAFSQDSRHLLTSGGDDRVVLWSLDTYTKVQEWLGSHLMCPVAIAPNGHFIGTGGYAIRVWQVGVDQPPLVESKYWATSCCFYPDSSVFAAFGAENAIMRWAIPGGDSLSGGWGGTRNSNDNVRFPTGPMAFHPTSSVIANCYGTLGENGFYPVLCFWDAVTGAPVDSLDVKFAVAHPSNVNYRPLKQAACP